MSTVAPAAEQAAPAEAPRPAPLPSRIVDVFFSPAQVFEQLRGPGAPWIGATLVCAFVSMAVALMRPLFVTNREMAEMVIDQMRTSGRAMPPGLTPEMLEKQMMIGTYVAPVISLVMAFLLVTVFAVALAALFSLMMGGRASFRSYLAVSSHASLVYMLGVVIVSALMYATKRLDLTLSAALLVPGLSPSSVPAAILGAITPFSLWLIALLAIGGAVVNRRRGWMGPAAALFAAQMVLVTAWSLLMHVISGRAGG